MNYGDFKEILDDLKRGKFILPIVFVAVIVIWAFINSGNSGDVASNGGVNIKGDNLGGGP